MSAGFQLLTVDEVREYIGDYAQNNYLLTGEEFSDTLISMCMSMAIDEYNSLAPISGFSLSNFPSKSVLMWGTLWKMYEGKAAQYARNTLSYSDGGVQVPVEEKAELYKGLAQGYHDNFESRARTLKTHLNIEDGWGNVVGDAAMFPIW